MSRKRVVSVLVALLVGAAVATPMAAGASSQADSADWQTLESEHFLVKYQSGYEADAQRTLQYMRFARNHTLDVFDTRLENKVEVYVHPWDEYSRSKWAVYTETRQADDRNGLDADVHLMAPSERPSPTQEERRQFFRHGMTHEYAQTHMYYAMLQNGEWVSMPSWFNQGIPEYVAMYHTTEDIREDQFAQTERVRDMIAQDSGYLMSISQSPYDSGPLVVKYVVEEHGWDAVMGILRTDHSNALLALESNLGVSVREFQNRWLVHASEEYGGDYPRAEARLADTDAHRTEDLLVRLDSKNETIDELRARLAAQNETIEEQDETIAGLRDTLQNQSDGEPTTDAADPAETTEASTGSSGGSSPGFGAGVALVSLLAAGVVAGRRGG